MPALTIAIVFSIIINCSEDDSFIPVETPDELIMGADAVIENFEVHSFTETGPLWHLKSDKAYVFQEEGVTHIFGIILNYYTGKRITTRVRGKKGLLKNKEKTFRIEGDVVVTSSNGRRLKTKYLTWYEEEKILRTDAPVLITFPGGNTVRSRRGMRANQTLEKLELFEISGTHQ